MFDDGLRPAQDILKEIFETHLAGQDLKPYLAYHTFVTRFHAAMQHCASDPEVAGFKSIACYRTGLNIGLMREGHAVEQCVTMVMLRYEATRALRLADKALNDYVVNVALRVSSESGKPGTRLLPRAPAAPR
jgi:hypothetical protein